ncbi:MAG: hypothetical protein WA418_33220 [Bradyrhizobium sp.]
MLYLIESNIILSTQGWGNCHLVLQLAAAGRQSPGEVAALGSLNGIRGQSSRGLLRGHVRQRALPLMLLFPLRNDGVPFPLGEPEIDDHSDVAAGGFVEPYPHGSGTRDGATVGDLRVNADVDQMLAGAPVDQVLAIVIKARGLQAANNAVNCA